MARNHYFLLSLELYCAVVNLTPSTIECTIIEDLRTFKGEFERVCVNDSGCEASHNNTIRTIYFSDPTMANGAEKDREEAVEQFDYDEEVE